MNIAIAGFTHETNTFAPIPTRLADFGARKGGGVPEGPDVFERVEAQSSFQGFCEAARAAGARLHPVLHAYAPPGGVIERECFETLATRIVAGIADAGRLDAVFLELHGAMVADGLPHAELELVRRVRAAVGPAVRIGVALDSHGNVSAALVDQVDAMSAYRTYPHVDMPHTGERVFRQLQRMQQGTRKLHKAFADVPFLMPLCRQSTLLQPAMDLYAHLQRLHDDNASFMDLSLMTGFPLADVGQCRPSMFGYGEDAGAVRAAVASMQARAMQAEGEFGVQLPGADEAVKDAMAAQRRPVVLADVQDNAGGGSSSDTVWILEALLHAGAPDAIVGMVYDPAVAAAALAAGVGADIDAELGGKLMPGHRPLRGRFRVEALRTEPVLLTGAMMGGTSMAIGPMARLRIGGVQVIVNSRRAQCLEQEYFRALGLEPEQHDVVVVKSTNHYRADFNDIAAEIVEFAAPGACAMDLKQLPYRHLAPGTRVPRQFPLERGFPCD